MTRLLYLSAVAAVLTSTGCTPSEPQEEAVTYTYPETRKDSSVADDYFGTNVADPYRWLEDDHAEETLNWGDEQNKLTYGFLETLPQRQKINDRLTELWNYEKYSTPFKRGNYYFFYKNDGMQNHSVLYIQDNLDAEPRVLIDPNTFSEDGTVSLGGTGISGDSKYMAYSTSQAGSDWQEIAVMEIESGKKLDDRIEWVKFSGISWAGNGFYYSRYPAPDESEEFSQKNEFHQLYYHELGTDQSADKLVMDDKNNPQRNFYASTTRDERFLSISSSISTSGNSLTIADLASSDKRMRVIDDTYDNEYSLIGNDGDRLYIVTNNGAPMNKLVRIDFSKEKGGTWEEVIPEGEALLESVRMCNGKLVARYLKDVSSQLIEFDYEGNQTRTIELPELGIVSGFSASKNEPVAFYSFTNYTNPNTIYRFDSETGESSVFRAPAVNFDGNQFESKQVFYASKDGTKIPMTIVHKKGLEMNGNNPTFLYGYGGFNISIKPSFRPDILPFLENGGIYAVPNIRGGGEYGEDWHWAGTKLEKQNVFDDFIGAAEYLIKEKYTSSDKLAVHGRSNGGLLVGAVMTQRPDLFKVALPQVGVLDMLRYHQFTIGWAWAADYGRSDDNKEQFDYLLGYSPIHNVEAKDYPATLVITGDHDDRVVPAHSFKFIAALQEYHTGNDPVMIRIEKSGGHGAGKPLSMRIAEVADTWAFTFHFLGVDMPAEEKG